MYRLKCPYDKSTNTFARKLDGTFEDIDVYIDCQYGNKVFSFGHGILQAYIPSIIRGHNIIKYISEHFGQEIIFDIEESDSEVLFKFKSKYDNNIIPLLKPKTNGVNISPFSSRNLPKSEYKIPDEDFNAYKNIVAKIPRERILSLTHMTVDFIKALASKNNKYNDIKADMALKRLKGKEYIHSIGKWNDYIDYINKNLQEIIE